MAYINRDMAISKFDLGPDFQAKYQSNFWWHHWQMWMMRGIRCLP